MLEAGRTLNHYEIVRLLGKGGMGEVYVARDRKLGREVALKVLPEEVASDRQRRERFEREARAVAALRHPNIVTLHAIDEAEGMTFMVMELVDGEPLSEAIPRGGFALDRFLEIAIPLADAVAAAHARGITHRDLKPANVLLDGAGRIQVLDFGLAKLSGEAGPVVESMQPTEALTGEGRIVGTIAYMSPEQVEGKPVDARSDIFSLGILFYELLTGVRPFEGDTGISVVTAILRDEPVSVTERNERLPRYMGRIVKRCLQKDPGRRYQSALDLRNDLVELREELASGEIETGATGTAATASGGPARRLVPVLGVLVVGLVAGLWIATRGSEVSEPAGAAYEVRRLIARGSPLSAAISPDGRHVVYDTLEGGERRLRLQQIATGSDIELVRGDTWSTLFRAVAFTPDGEYVRYLQSSGDTLGTIWEIPALGGAPKRLLDGLRAGIAYSPEGSRVAFVSVAEITDPWRRIDVVSLADGERRTVLELSEAGVEVLAVAWSPNGGRLALAFSRGAADDLALLSLEDGSLTPVPGSFALVNRLCWSPDGEHLVVVGNPDKLSSRTQLWGVDPDSGRRRPLVSDFSGYSGCSSSADGRLTATVREQWHSQLWVVPVDDPNAARSIPTTTGRDNGTDHVAWLGSDALVYGAPDGDGWGVWKIDVEGGGSVRISSDAAWPVSGHTGRIGFESGWIGGRQGIYVMDTPGPAPWRVSPEDLFAQRPAISPDGEWVLYELLTDEGMRFVRTPASGGEPEVVTTALAHLAEVSPDGSRVAVHAINSELGRWQTAIFPIGSSTPERWLDIHSEATSPWAGNDALYISRTVAGVENVYRVDLDDLSEQQTTFFKDGNIFSFSVSPDLKQLVISRGENVNDLLLIEGLLEAGE